MKKFTKITMTISLVCIVVGMALLVATGFLGDLYHGLKKLNFGPNGIDIQEFVQLEEGDKDYHDTRIAGNEIRELEISVKAATLKVITDDKQDGITIVDGSEALNVRHFIEEDTLSLYIEKKNKYRSNTSLDDVTLTLMIPEHLKFDELEIDLNAGAMNAEGLEAEKFGLDLNASAVMLNDVEAGTLDVDGNAGALFLKGEVQKELDLSCNAGAMELELKGAYEDFSYEINSKIGEIRVGRHEYSGLSDSVLEEREDVQKKAKLECKAGSIDVQFYE